MNKIKSLLKNFWFWLRSKTTLDEKAIDVYEEISDRAKEMKKELKDVKKAFNLSGQVCIMFRDVSGVDAGVDGQSDNPFEFEEVKQRIINSLELEGFKMRENLL